MNTFIKTLAILTTTHCLFVSCVSKKTASEPQNEPTVEESAVISSPQQDPGNVIKQPPVEQTTKVRARIGEFAKESDPLIIDTVVIKGNTLFIHVQYGGGCTTHEFEVVGSPMLAKSYPPIRSLQLIHRANNDLCLAMVQAVIEVNIEDVVELAKEGREIYFSLEGWQQRIHHTYVKD